MSHELRTPLNAIIGFSEIMESGMFGPLGAEKYGEYCRDIRQSGHYLLDVINDILDMSKIEAGRITPRPTRRSSSTPFLNDAMRVVSARAEDKQLDAQSPRSRPAIRLHGRPAPVKQIMINLLVQCGEVHARRRPHHVRARAPRRAASTSRIHDTGIGIPKDALTKLGRPFEQVESQLTKSHQGSGLGLAIAKSLTELHGGAMRIRSTLGRAPWSCCAFRKGDLGAGAGNDKGGLGGAEF